MVFVFALMIIDLSGLSCKPLFYPLRNGEYTSTGIQRRWYIQLVNAIFGSPDPRTTTRVGIHMGYVAKSSVVFYLACTVHTVKFNDPRPV